MARIFSIHFTYHGALQHAMISVRTTPFFMEYTVAMLDESIAAQLPNNKMISTSKGSVVFSDSTDENSPALMQEIIQAVTVQLHVLDA